MIETKDLVKVYGEGEQAFQALRGLSFEIQDGEFFFIELINENAQCGRRLACLGKTASPGKQRPSV